jgi:hypothetical protein
MFPVPRKTVPLAVVLGLAFGFADPAHAFRCGTKLVKEDMHQQQVIAICGEPTTRRHMGYAVRGVPYGWRRVTPGGRETWYPRGGTLTEEVIVTEWVYNFGPRKLMRRLIFHGGVLVEIDTIGYGYIEKDDDDGE